MKKLIACFLLTGCTTTTAATEIVAFQAPPKLASYCEKRLYFYPIWNRFHGFLDPEICNRAGRAGPGCEERRLERAEMFNSEMADITAYRKAASEEIGRTLENDFFDNDGFRAPIECCQANPQRFQIAKGDSNKCEIHHI